MLPQRHKYFESRGFNECDIDMFLVGLSANEANDRIRALYEHLRTFGDTTVVRTKCAITFMQEHPHRAIRSSSACISRRRKFSPASMWTLAASRTMANEFGRHSARGAR